MASSNALILHHSTGAGYGSDIAHSLTLVITHLFQTHVT